MFSDVSNFVKGQIYNKDKKTRDCVDKFPTNILKSITFLHPRGVCGWTFHRTGNRTMPVKGVFFPGVIIS